MSAMDPEHQAEGSFQSNYFQGQNSLDAPSWIDQSMPSISSLDPQNSPSSPWNLNTNTINLPSSSLNPTQPDYSSSLPLNFFTLDPGLTHYNSKIQTKLAANEIQIQSQFTKDAPTYQFLHQPNQGFIVPSALTHDAQNHSVSKALPTALSNSPNMNRTKHDLLSNIPMDQSFPTNSTYSLKPMAAMLQDTKSAQYSRYVSLSTQPVDLDCTKISVIPKYEGRSSARKMRQTDGLEEEVKSKLDRLERKANVRSGYSSLSASSKPLGNSAHKSQLSPSDDSDSSESESESDSDDDDAVKQDEKKKVEEGFPLPLARPSDALKAIEFDVTKALWHPRSKFLCDDVLIARIAEFSAPFPKWHDEWKADNDLLKQAVKNEQTSQLPGLRAKVQKQRSILETVYNTAIKHGHPEILSMLGEYRGIIASLKQLLIDRHREKEFNGRFTITLLRVLSKFKTLTEKTLEETQLTKVLTAFNKKGNDEVKKLILAIRRNANIPDSNTPVTSPKPSPAQASTTVETTNVLKPVKQVKQTRPTSAITKKAAPAIDMSGPRVISSNRQIAAKAAESSNGDLKRPRSGAEILGPPSKRAATLTGGKSAKTSTLNVAGPKTLTKKPAGTAAAKPKVINFSSTSAVRKANSDTIAPVKPSFNFGSILETYGAKSVQFEVESKTKSDMQETNLEKTKRLRKEARQKLRVTWKPDHEIEDIRYFTHDPEEDTRQNASSVRDAGDITNEGLAFKKGSKNQQTFEDDADDEDGDEYKVEVFGDESSFLISAIDVDVIAAEDRERNFARFLGPKTPHSPASELLAKRENNELMAMYMKRSDIPPTPRSPIDPNAGPQAQTIRVGGPVESSRAYMMMLQDRNQQAQQVSQQPLALDLAGIMKSLNAAAGTTPVPQAPVQTQQYYDPQSALPFGQASLVPSYTQPAAAQSASSILAALGLVPQPTAAAAKITAPHAAPPSTSPAISNDLTALLAQLNAQTSNNSVPTQPQPAFVPPQAAQATTPTAATMQPNDAANIIAQLSWYYGAQQMAAAAGSAGGPSSQVESSANQGYEHPDRRRIREMGDVDGRNDGFKRANNNGGVSVGGAGAKWGGGTKPKWIKEEASSFKDKKWTLPCKFFANGKCMKGDNCTYIHPKPNDVQ